MSSAVCHPRSELFMNQNGDGWCTKCGSLLRPKLDRIWPKCGVFGRFSASSRSLSLPPRTHLDPTPSQPWGDCIRSNSSIFTLKWSHHSLSTHQGTFEHIFQPRLGRFSNKAENRHTAANSPLAHRNVSPRPLHTASFERDNHGRRYLWTHR